MPKKATEPRRGFETTEFIVVAALVIAATVLAAMNVLDAARWEAWVEFVKWVAGAFVISRGVAKLQNGNKD